MRESQIGAIMRNLARRQITRQEAADLLKCSVRTVNRIMARRGVVRQESRWSEADRARRARKEAKLQAGKAVLTGRWRLETAAEKVGLTPRSMEKWVEKARKLPKTTKNGAKNAEIRQKQAKTA